MENKTAYVLIKMELKEDADLSKIIEDMNYELKHAGINDTEIVEYFEEYPIK